MNRHARIIVRGSFVAAAWLVWGAGPAGADYETHPEVRPESRCVTETGESFAEAGIDPIHCQKLIWDLPPAPRLGFVAAGAPFDTDAVPRFPNGLTDRVPPRYIYDPDGDGIADDCDASHPSGVYAGNPDCGDGIGDGFETIPTGFTAAELGRQPLCPDIDELPWWQPVQETHPDGTRSPVEGFGEPLAGVGDFGETGDMGQQRGPLFQVACRRGTRAYLGPWQVGTNPARYDEIGSALVRFESSKRMDRDYQNWPEDAPTPPRRLEWNTGSEIYNHFASHHMTIWNAGNQTCNNPDDPESASDMSKCGEGYQFAANPPPELETDPDQEGPHPGPCWYGNVLDAGSCPNQYFESSGNAFRNGTQLPGRIHVQLPDGRAAPSLEDQIWPAQHHVVHQLPPGSYGLPDYANYRLQRGGLTNTSDEPRFDAAPGEVIGGAVAEAVFQYFTAPYYQGDLKPLSVYFEVVQDLATTFYPPFTYVAKETVWYPPFDAAIGLITTHSHHRSVRIHIDQVPANPLRLESPDPACGGGASGTPAEHLFDSWQWEDAKVCEYWQEPDGPVIARKGQALRTTCYTNNGVTPEAIKHGLVAGSTVEMLRQLSDGAIPEQPGTVPVETWEDAFVQSPAGTLLYGTHPTDNYRVKYACGPAPGVTLDVPLNDGTSVCDPNPAVDADGDYVDGPYRNEAQCGGDWCNPATVVFANVGEDEMCISVFMYWPLERLLNHDGSVNEEAMQNLEEGNVDEVGTPGRLWRSPSDAGNCNDGAPADDGELGIENPNNVTGAGRCRIGL